MNDKSGNNSGMMSNISDFLEQEESDHLVNLPIDDIDPNPNQDRHSWEEPETTAHLEAMTTSVKTNGVRRPIEVFEHVPGRFQIIAGEMRYRAAKAADLDTIPALVRLNLDEKQRSLDMFTENFSRLGLMPMELARALKKRIDQGITREELMTAVGKDKAWLSRILGLLQLPDDVQIFAAAGKVRDVARLHALAQLEEETRGVTLARIESGEITTKDALAAQQQTSRTDKKSTKPDAKKVSKQFVPNLTMTPDEARALIVHFHPDWPPCETDYDLDERFKIILGELKSGEFRPAATPEA